MMTIDDIKKLIAKDETRIQVVKKTTSELYKGMETACAFLNSDGGWLMFGITPSLKIDGQNVTDNTRQEPQTPQVNEINTPSDTPRGKEVQSKSILLSPQDRVFEFCNTPKSITEIANMLGVKDKKWVRKKYVTPFLGTKLQMTIPDKPNSKHQKYQTIDETLNNI